MNSPLLALVAAVCNVGTIACIKMCKHAAANGPPMAVWILGIAVAILATQFLLLRADIKGASLGRVVSAVIASVMVAAPFMGIDDATGHLPFVLLKEMPLMETGGYVPAVIGVLLFCVSQQMQPANSYSDALKVVVAEQ